MELAVDLPAVLARVEKPTRYIGTELNSVHKAHDQVKVKLVLAFPDTYEVGMSHLGTVILYHAINQRADTVAERVFAPWVDMEAQMRQRQIPLFALESGVPIRDFDIVGFTLQYEMTYTNILNMLDLAGIPLRSADRSGSDPFVIAGGPCAFNVEPLAEFFDLVVLGEGEEVIHELIDAHIDWQQESGRNRSGFLERAAQIPGVYVPAFYQVDYHPDGTVERVFSVHPAAPARVTKRVVADLDALDYPTRPIVPFMEIVHDRVMLEVFRGCSRGCRFCQAGMLYRPVRERSLANCQRLARELIDNTGHSEISLSSLNTSDYSGVAELVGDLVQQYQGAGVGISLPSSRIDSFSVELARQIQSVRKTGLTLAPEAGTQRLRDVINKNVTEADFIAAVSSAFRSGWTSLKFYFMIGLPTETYADLDGIASLAFLALDLFGAISRESKGPHKTPRITISASSFVPKTHTPFQWEPQFTVAELRARQDYLKRKLRHRHLQFNWHEAEVSHLEAVLARGDRRLGQVLTRAWQSGCRFDGWGEHFRARQWQEAFVASDIDPDFYANRRRGETEVLPWDHLDAGVTKAYLWSEQEKAVLGVNTADCRFEHCFDCGVCPSLGVELRVEGGGNPAKA
jgi:radical SAM family uncharacterized protein